MKKAAIVLTVVLCFGCSSTGGNTSQTDTPAAEVICRNIIYYDYGAPVPQSTVSDDWFADAIVIGDMRAGSMALYSDLAYKGAEIIYEESLGVYSLKTTPIQMSTSTACVMVVVMPLVLCFQSSFRIFSLSCSFQISSVWFSSSVSAIL